MKNKFALTVIAYLLGFVGALLLGSGWCLVLLGISPVFSAIAMAAGALTVIGNSIFTSRKFKQAEEKS